MNAVEIEEAVSALAEAPFDPEDFPYAFLAAFGNKPTTIKRLKKGATNHSDIPGGVLQINNIHVAVCEPGKVGETLKALHDSPATQAKKAKYILATDGRTIEAENLVEGETLACNFEDLANHFGFFLPLAGITTVKQIRENAFDIKATSRLNKLYVELLKENPDWDTTQRREDLNHFFARLIFCFFAEDTNIFHSQGLFTATIDQMSERDSSNTHEVISELFRAMNTKHEDRKNIKIRSWADTFPYVNGGLFSGSLDVPRFSKIARSYLLHIGGLDWQRINPDIFGSMIQAVADDEERGTLGMHYTSVPNILKVLNPLFLDDLREKLKQADDNKRKLLNLRNRMARIRVFDPACGSGNFLVIAYKEMRAIEAEINKRRGEADRSTDIPLTNFRGIELRHFSAEIARLALIIAEYQCDVLYRGERLALAEFLPLEAANWITCGNALRIDWLSICPPTGSGVKLHTDDLFETSLDQSEMDFENEGGETYICGNPPYLGSKWQSKEQKADLAVTWARHASLARNSDYVTEWVARFLDYSDLVHQATASFVTTNSLCQGQQASILWPIVFDRGVAISFARLPFKWCNLARDNAGVTVCIIGMSADSSRQVKLYDGDTVRHCSSIGPYLAPDFTQTVTKSAAPLGPENEMLFGNMPRDGGHLLLNPDEIRLLKCDEEIAAYIKRIVGSKGVIQGIVRYCLWIEDADVDEATNLPVIRDRLKSVAQNRSQSCAESTRAFAKQPHRFVQIAGVAKEHSIVMPRVSSETRDFLPVDYLYLFSV